MKAMISISCVIILLPLCTAAASQTNDVVSIKVDSVMITNKYDYQYIVIAVEITSATNILFDSFYRNCSCSIQFDGGRFIEVGPHPAVCRNSEPRDWLRIRPDSPQQHAFSQWGGTFAQTPPTTAVIKVSSRVKVQETWQKCEITSATFTNINYSQPTPARDGVPATHEE
jgi:hypothetical protein